MAVCMLLIYIYDLCSSNIDPCVYVHNCACKYTDVFRPAQFLFLCLNPISVFDFVL